MVSSISLESIWAPAPSTSRGIGVHLSWDRKSQRIAYGAGKSVILREIFTKDKKVTQYTGHVCNTSVAKFSPSGAWIASGDVNGNVRVWSSEGELNTKYEGNQVINGRINDLSWDGDSQRIIAVGNGRDKFGHCFTYDTGNSIGEISGHSASCNGVSIRQSRPYRAATVSDDGGLVFYTGPPFKYSSKDVNHSNGKFLHCVEFSNGTGKYLACAGSSGEISLYDGKSGEYLSIVGKHDGSVFAISWLGDNLLASASADCQVKVWDVGESEPKLVKSFTLGTGLEYQQVGVVFTSENQLISLSFNGDLNILSLETGQLEKVICGHQGSITSLLYVEESSKLVSGGFDGKILIWDLDDNQSGKPVSDPHSNLVKDLVKVSDKQIVSCGWDDVLKVIDVGSGKVDKNDSLPHQPIQLCVLEDGNLAVLYQESYQINGQVVKLNDSATAITSFGNQLIIGYQNGKVTTTTTSNKNDQKDLVNIQAGLSITCLAIIPSKNYIVIGTNSGKCFVYNVENGKLITSRWSFNTARITDLSVGEEEQLVATGSLDTSIYIYNIETPSKIVKTMNCHRDGVNKISFIGTTKTLVSCGGDGCIKWWNLT